MILTIGFGLAEKLVFHIEVQSESVSYSPNELLLAAGLVLLNPGELIIVQMIGATFATLVWRRQELLKLSFNLATFAGSAIASAIVWTIGDDTSLQVWLGTFTGLTLAMASGGVLIVTAVSQFEGKFRRRIREQLRNVPIFYVPTAAVGAAIAVPMTIDPWLGAPAAIAAPLVWYVVRSHGTLMHRYSDLANVQDFSRVVGAAGNLNQLADRAAERLAAASRAEHVSIRLWAGGDTIDATIGFAGDHQNALPTPGNTAWETLLAEPAFTRLDAAQAVQLGLPADLTDPLVAGLRDERGLFGVVVIAERGGALSAFSDDDIARLETMRQQLVVAVRKAQLNNQIQYEATHDQLTGLSNRAFFEAWLDRRVRDGRTGTVALIDLDRFKPVNDAFGHHAGDQLLRTVGEKISSACTDADLAARLSSDEFAIFFDGMNAHDAGPLIEALGRLIGEPIDIGPTTVVTTASLGIAETVDALVTPSELLRRADLAMSASKRANITAATTYTAELEHDESEHLRLAADLRTAIAEDQLQVYFQPQIDIASGRVAGAEALVRWIHPEHGFVSPETFVGMAEEAGLINDLTRSVLQHAAHAARSWHDRDGTWTCRSTSRPDRYKTTSSSHSSSTSSPAPASTPPVSASRSPKPP